MTDIHYDPFYATSMAEDSRGANCTSPNAAPFGQLGCDSPWALVKSMLVAAHAEEPNPDAVLMLGDFTRHHMDQLENPTAIIKEIWQNISALASSLWPSVRPVFHLQPLVGNNDLRINYGVNVTTGSPPGSSVNGSIVDPWMQTLSHAWAAGSFSEQELVSWNHGGYYVREQPAGSGNLIVSLNTVAYSPGCVFDLGGLSLCGNVCCAYFFCCAVVCSAQKFIPPQFAVDPYGQWQWLESVLDSAQQSDGKQR
jgi:hypothetical protein